MLKYVNGYFFTAGRITFQKENNNLILVHDSNHWCGDISISNNGITVKLNSVSGIPFPPPVCVNTSIIKCKNLDEAYRIFIDLYFDNLLKTVKDWTF